MHIYFLYFCWPNQLASLYSYRFPGLSFDRFPAPTNRFEAPDQNKATQPETSLGSAQFLDDRQRSYRRNSSCQSQCNLRVKQRQGRSEFIHAQVFLTITDLTFYRFQPENFVLE